MRWECDLFAISENYVRIRVIGVLPLKSQNRPRIGRGDRDVAWARGAHPYKAMFLPPATARKSQWAAAWGIKAIPPQRADTL
jgi:hypothetical protein